MITEHEKLIAQELASSDATAPSSSDHTPSSEVLPTDQHSLEAVPDEAALPQVLPETPLISEDQMHIYVEGLSNLTPTERAIYNLYISGNTTKEIMASLNIKENTLKFHNKNIYGKLGVSSRKQLIELSKQLEQ